MRRYAGVMSDNSRWERFELRPDDVVISTPAKCGTTWTQQIVGMLLLGRAELGAPIATISPWLDVCIFTDDDVFGILDVQTHRRFIKTHTPLDGLPMRDSVTYLTVFRHPLDVALSFRDHGNNLDLDRLITMRVAAAGMPDELPVEVPDDPAEYLRWWISNDREPSGTGARGLEDYANSLAASWDAAAADNVHLFHYVDLWNDLGGELQRFADVLGIELSQARHAEYVEAATLDAMRSRAADTAPFADSDHYRDPADFFAAGGGRDWHELLSAAEIAEVERRLVELVGTDAAEWALRSPASA